MSAIRCGGNMFAGVVINTRSITRARSPRQNPYCQPNFAACFFLPCCCAAATYCCCSGWLLLRVTPACSQLTGRRHSAHLSAMHCRRLQCDATLAISSSSSTTTNTSSSSASSSAGHAALGQHMCDSAASGWGALATARAVAGLHAVGCSPQFCHFDLQYVSTCNIFSPQYDVQVCTSSSTRTCAVVYFQCMCAVHLGRCMCVVYVCMSVSRV